MNIKEKIRNRIRRHRRVRAVIKGTAARPRLSVFRSSGHIYAQLIDDAKGSTLLSAGDIKNKTKEEGNRAAYKIGEILAGKAIEKGIKEAVFDRGGYKYHGRVRALAEGARKGGLKF